MAMIDRINTLLAEMGSTFRTDDGVTLIKHLGGLTFLRRSFDSPAECLRFVEVAANHQRCDFANNFLKITWRYHDSVVECK